MTISGISSNSYSTGLMASMMRSRTASGATEQTTTRGKPDVTELFTKLDADGSGGLDSTEVQSLTEKISEVTGVSVDLSEFLATYDSDGDGSLSEDETVAALEANHPQGPPPGGMTGRMKGPDETDLVGAADTNGDGVISAEEAEGLVDIINNATGSSLKAEDFIGSYDENGDGSLSTDEAVAAMEANRPQGPPPSSESQAAETEGLDSILASAIEKYLKMAAMGMDGQTGSDLSTLLGGTTNSVSKIA
jgi:Ca2+-binding EF-hand superfamily protein